jgi:hypothetical protein
VKFENFPRDHKQGTIYHLVLIITNYSLEVETCKTLSHINYKRSSDRPLQYLVTDQHVTNVVTDQSVTSLVTDQHVTSLVTDQLVTNVVTDQSVTSLVTDQQVTGNDDEIPRL